MLWHLAARLPPSRKAALTLVSLCGLQQGPDPLLLSLQWLSAVLELTRASSPLVLCSAALALQDFGSRGAAAGCRGVQQGVFLARQPRLGAVPVGRNWSSELLPSSELLLLSGSAWSGRVSTLSQVCGVPFLQGWGFCHGSCVGALGCPVSLSVSCENVLHRFTCVQ